MIGDVVGGRVVGHHRIALLEGGAHDERFVIFLEPQEQLAADFECDGSVGRAFRDFRDGERGFAHVVEGDGHVFDYR